ncbi:hypothetical protein [Vagococcus acidifermentans]|nr:hypothetical protein [Vagococcus acidifermentans]
MQNVKELLKINARKYFTNGSVINPIASSAGDVTGLFAGKTGCVQHG